MSIKINKPNYNSDQDLPLRILRTFNLIVNWNLNISVFPQKTPKKNCLTNQSLISREGCARSLVSISQSFQSIEKQHSPSSLLIDVSFRKCMSLESNRSGWTCISSHAMIATILFPRSDASTTFLSLDQRSSHSCSSSCSPF